MRHCFNDAPMVFEAESSDFPALMRQVADEAERQDSAWSSINVSTNISEGEDLIYRATLYLH